MEKILSKQQKDTQQWEPTLDESFALVEFLTVLAEVDMEQRIEQKHQKEVGNKNNENNRS